VSRTVATAPYWQNAGWTSGVEAGPLLVSR